MTSRTDLCADKLRRRILAHDGITWATDWDDLADPAREFWRAQVRAVLADVLHSSHDAPCDPWEPYSTAGLHVGTDHTTRRGTDRDAKKGRQT